MLVTLKNQASEQVYADARKPKDTKKDKIHYFYYHPLYCTVLGHTTASSTNYGITNKTPAERREITMILKSMNFDCKLVLVQELSAWKTFLTIVVDQYYNCEIYFLLYT